MKTELFGKTAEGREVKLYTLENKKGVKARVMNYGAILVNLLVPDQNGNVEDICLGYDKLEDYFVNGCYFGATIGPNGNRIANAAFEMDGVKYQLDVNDGPNNLHSHPQEGFHKRVWDAKEDENSVVFYIESKDSDMGFPGNKKISVTYTLTEDNELKIDYYGTSDKMTILNLTNHSYFNLAGHNHGSIEKHQLLLKAAHYTPVVKGLIPTGEIAPVKGTPMDFTKAKKIGKEIDENFDQLSLAGGYDHNWVLDNWNGTLQHFATLEEKESGRKMEVFTDLPGVQFYAGNFITRHTGKQNAVYDFRGGMCLETQNFPNAANEHSFPSPFFGPGRDYHTTTVYKFV